MATLANKSVKATLSAVVKYNNNPDKNSPRDDGLARAAAYIHGDHSIERLYSRGHNGCSCNPKLAIEMFRVCERMYREKKGGAKESGLGRYEMDPNKYAKKFGKPGVLNENGKVWVEKQPVIAEHLFLSFPPEENVSYEMQCEIADRLCESPLLKDFYAISNRHYNTDNDHSHILVSNFSKDGSKKLSLTKTKRQALRKELDRICVSYGLSIIDNPTLRYKDPEREAFVRDCVGKVTVYAPADYERHYTDDFGKWMLEQIENGRVLVAEDVSKNRSGESQADAYRRWIAEQEEIIRAKNKKATQYKKVVLITAEQTKSKAARMYYWDERYKKNKHYYAIRRYDDYGHHKPLLVLVLELLLVVMKNENIVINEPIVRTTTDYNLQRAMDALRLQDEQGVRTPAELDRRIQEVGTELSEVRQGKAYYTRAFEQSEELLTAIRTYNKLKKKEDRTETEEKVIAEAWRIMVSKNCTEPLQQGDFMRRRTFAERKIKALEEQEKRLRKDYHDLKFIEGQQNLMRAEVEHYYYKNRSIEDIIRDAESRTVAKKSKNSEKMQERY